MSNVEIASIPEGERNTLLLGYASLLLFDGEKDLTEDNLKKLFTISKNKVDPIFTKVFASALEGKELNDYLSVGGGGNAGGE